MKRKVAQIGRHTRGTRGRKLPTLEKRGEIIVKYDKLALTGVKKTNLISTVAFQMCVGYHVAWRTINKRAVYEEALGWVGKTMEERTMRSKGGRKKRKAGRGVKFIQAVSNGKYPLAEAKVFAQFTSYRKAGKKVKSRMVRRDMRVAVLEHYGITSFTGSQGWIRRFMKRHNIVFRRRFLLCATYASFLFLVLAIGTTRRKRAWLSWRPVFATSSAPFALFVSRLSIRH